jgi:hypothetical protein
LRALGAAAVTYSPIDKINATVDRTLNTTMGVLPCISATRGAMIVTILAKKLQIPMADAQKRVGNIELCAMYTKLKQDAAPNEALNTKAGNTSGEVAVYPKNKII